MLDFNKLKDTILKLLDGEKNSDCDDYDITAWFQKKVYIMSSAFIYEEDKENSEKIPITFKNEEFQDLYKNLISDNMGFYNKNTYEIVLKANIRFSFHFDDEKGFFLESSDKQNKINYEIGRISPEYYFGLIKKLVESSDYDFEGNLKVFPVLRKDFTMMRLDGNIPKENSSFKDILSKRCFAFSLKIKSYEPLDESYYKKLANAFIFGYMHKFHNSLSKYKDINEFFNHSPTLYNSNRVDLNLLDAPLRIYKDDLLNYYHLAMSSNEPFIQYISFYHIIEYFYDELFNKNIIKKFQKEITNPDFSLRDEEKILKLVKDINKQFKSNKEDGQGNELESLKLVLNEFINIEKLENRINELNSEAIGFYRDNKVSFSFGSPSIQWGNSGVNTEIAKRVYFTRNSLVHSKNSQKEKCYSPYRDEKELEKEIAELIIINSSDLLL